MATTVTFPVEGDNIVHDGTYLSVAARATLTDGGRLVVGMDTARRLYAIYVIHGERATEVTPEIGVLNFTKQPTPFTPREMVELAKAYRRRFEGRYPHTAAGSNALSQYVSSVLNAVSLLNLANAVFVAGRLRELGQQAPIFDSGQAPVISANPYQSIVSAFAAALGHKFNW